MGKRFDSSSSTFQGVIDDVRIYDRALSADEIQYIYKSFDTNITYYTDRRVPKYFNGDDWVAMGESKYVPNAVDFDGNADEELRSNGLLAGVNDGKQWTASFWFKFINPASGAAIELFDIQDSISDISIIRQTSNRLDFNADNAAGSQILRVRTNTNFVDTNWHHVLFSADLATGIRHLYVDGASNIDGAIFTMTDDLMNLTPDGAEGFIIGGSGGNPSNQLNGFLSDFWIDFGTYVDLSVEANRRKFIDENGDPVYLGATGSLPTGSAPDVFLSGDTSTWHVNKGTGGGFTKNGELSDAITKPGQIFTYTMEGVRSYQFDGNGSEYLVANPNPMYGQLDSKLLTGSFWFKSRTANNTTPRHFFATTSSGFGDLCRVYIDAAEKINFDCSNATSTVRLDAIGSTNIYDTNWHHIVFSFDMANTANRHVYIDGVAEAMTYNTYSNNALSGIAGESFNFNNDSNQNRPLDGDFGDFWLDYGTYIDLSVPENLEKFYYNGGPVYLGPKGEYVTGAPADVYFSGDRYDWVADGAYQFATNGTSQKFAVPGAVPSGIGKLGECANPARKGGSLIYNATSQVMQYCDGANWQAVGP
jgi:hypothetical protein